MHGVDPEDGETIDPERLREQEKLWHSTDPVAPAVAADILTWYPKGLLAPYSHRFADAARSLNSEGSGFDLELWDLAASRRATIRYSGPGVTPKDVWIALRLLRRQPDDKWGALELLPAEGMSGEVRLTFFPKQAHTPTMGPDQAPPGARPTPEQQDEDDLASGTLPPVSDPELALVLLDARDFLDHRLLKRPNPKQIEEAREKFRTLVDLVKGHGPQPLGPEGEFTKEQKTAITDEQRAEHVEIGQVVARLARGAHLSVKCPLPSMAPGQKEPRRGLRGKLLECPASSATGTLLFNPSKDYPLGGVYTLRHTDQHHTIFETIPAEGFSVVDKM